jgi:hypothetical protein
MASNFPTPIGITNDEDRAFHTELSLIALVQYNADQVPNYLTTFQKHVYLY